MKIQSCAELLTSGCNTDPVSQCEMHALYFPPFQKESTLSSWASFPGAEASSNFSSLNEVLLFLSKNLLASKVLLTPSVEAKDCPVNRNPAALLSRRHAGWPHGDYLKGPL